MSIPTNWRAASLPAVPAELDLDVHLGSTGGLASLRRRLHTWGVMCGLSDSGTDDIVIAVDEITTNALEHGRPPARVRGWTTTDAVFVQVDDHGSIPMTAINGYHRPPVDSRRGRGVWIARHLTDALTACTAPTGTTVALRFPRSPASL